jgi:hypothetical protein
MTNLDHRQKAFSDKYAHDQELRFKIVARRNYLLGLWAADEMNLDDDKAKAYARTVVSADFDEAGDEDVLRKVLDDLVDSGLNIDERELRFQMNELLDKAEEEVKAR